jgi:hypothetical protein
MMFCIFGYRLSDLTELDRAAMNLTTRMFIRQIFNHTSVSLLFIRLAIESEEDVSVSHPKNGRAKAAFPGFAKVAQTSSFIVFSRMSARAQRKRLFWLFAIRLYPQKSCYMFTFESISHTQTLTTDCLIPAYHAPEFRQPNPIRMARY